jgi:Asp-tRNA(Asn)/Glu-tRNA(Gln) amidotransferase A subunit family amidase
MIEEMDALLRPFDAVITTNYDANQLQITNLTGHPVVAMPSGFRNGLPTSVTVLGNYFSEATILAVAKVIQDNTDFEDKHPERFMK